MSWQARLVGLLGALILGMAIMFPLCQFTSAANVSEKVAISGTAALVVPGKLCGPTDCQPALLFHGGVSEESMSRLRSAVASLPEGSWVCLSSPGGESDAARVTATYLRERKIGTCVVPLGSGAHPMATECGSACSTLWLGGAKRLLALDGAAVGFHQAFIGEGWCCGPSNAVKAAQARWAAWRDGHALGDAQARETLYVKGKDCGTAEFYRLRTYEAAQLGLVPRSDLEAQWAWRPDAPVELPALPVARDCASPT